MIRRLVAVLSLFIAASQWNAALAQMGAEGPGVQRFLSTAPAIGEPLPDVSIVDDQGSPVSLRDLTGENYTVLVLGCLT